MPHNIVGKPPFKTVTVFDEDRDFGVADLKGLAAKHSTGITLCVRFSQGHPRRGGYFFHFVPTSSKNAEFQIYDFEKKPVKIFMASELVDFINHCTGRKFHEPSFMLCQSELNFLKDEEPNV